jgi:hypothetical protein
MRQEADEHGLEAGVLDSRATFSLWTRALASGKYAAAQPFAVG